MAADKSGFCRTLGRKICLHLFVFVFYKDQMDALSLFFFFFVLIFGREKPQERLTLKFLWMPLLCARTSRLAYWDNTGYPQHKRSATHLSSCTAVCVAVLPLCPVLKLFPFGVLTFSKTFSLFFFLTNIKNISWSLTSVVVDGLCLFLPANGLNRGLLYFCEQS